MAAGHMGGLGTAIATGALIVIGVLGGITTIVALVGFLMGGTPGSAICGAVAGIALGALTMRTKRHAAAGAAVGCIAAVAASAPLVNAEIIWAAMLLGTVYGACVSSVGYLIALMIMPPAPADRKE